MRRLVVCAVMLGVFAVLAPATAGAAGSTARVTAVKVQRPGLFHIAGLGARPAVVATNLHVRQFHPTARITNRAIALTGSVKTFTKTITVSGTPYTYTIVGKNPFVAQTNPVTTVKTFTIDVIFHNGSDTFDPNAADPCDPAGAGALYRTVNSPIFKTTANTWGGTAVGNYQYISAFQRAEFWSQAKPTGINPGYNTKLNLANTLQTTYANSSYPEYTAGCEPLLEVPIGVFDSFAQSVIASASSLGVGPKTFPLLLVHNVVFTQGTQCCILGYHSAFGSPVQTYGVADYDTTGAFGATVNDVSAMSHEVGEWMNDPTTNNPTPAWGHTGQVSGCQSNLEVGDPLSGTVFNESLNSFPYTLQELAFFSWFYHQSPSLGVNGWYSNKGTFTTPAAACS